MPNPPTPLATVVPLKRGPSTWPAPVRQAWETLEQALRPAYATWGDAADDALFRQSERSEEGMRYFEAMRLLRKIRAQLEADIQARFRQGVERWLGPSSSARPDPSTPVTLTLVGHEELEEALAVDAMAERGARDPQWDAFRQRLARVCDRPVGPTPLEPEALAQAARGALDAIEPFDTAVRLLLLKLFERHVWPVLGAVAAELNSQLIAQGILPQLGTPVTPSRPPSAATLPAASPGAASSLAPGPGFPSAPFALPANWTPAVAQELWGVLQQLRASPADPAQAPSPRQWRDQLLAQLPDPVRQPAHEQAIDLVAMVFEFLLRDDLMPAPVLAVLGRLQLPYLRVAVLDPHGFAQAQHPARQLLEVLGEVGQTWTEADDRTGEILIQLRATVDRLADAADTDLKVFPMEHEAWQARLAQRHTRANRASERAIAHQAGQDKREAAQRAVAQAFLQRLGNVPLPDGILTLLRHWKAAMTLLWLREGATSAAYRSAVFLLDQVRAMAQVQAGSPAAERLDRMRPALRLTLDRGLALLSFEPAIHSAMIATFDAFLGERTGHPHPRAVVVPIPELPPAPEPMATPTARPAPAANVITPEVVPPLSDEAAAELAIGTWLAFELDGVAHRGKLSWVSPFTRRWLVVSAQGLKIADLDPHDVSRQMAAGTAQVIPPEGPVRRALDAQERP